MPIYKEKEDKNILLVSDLNNLVVFKVECQFGTITEVSYDLNGLKTVGCGEQIILGTASTLKGRTMTCNGSSGNPEGKQITIIHTFYEEGGETLIYDFPGDYTGEPDFDEQDPEPSFKFYVKFI